jgi:hypothetical protein
MSVSGRVGRSSRKIAPAQLQGGQCDKPCRFRAQDPWAQLHGFKRVLPCQVEFLIGKAAFGADQNCCGSGGGDL